MFDEVTTLIKDAVKAARLRIEPVEADVADLKAGIAEAASALKEAKADLAEARADLDDVKTQLGAMKNLDLSDIKSEVDAISATSARSVEAVPIVDETKDEPAKSDAPTPSIAGL